ncbi:hypothetical protein AAG570_010089 [Ranatra chinensis]|uniref:Glutathione S-transferase theta-1 n=1 Tax=Ranatra chinensis TaxID=642074 RepID=A0ABD0YXQ3_9HEMI
MSKIKLYSDNLSQPCRAVEIFLLTNNIPYELEFIDLLEGKQKKKHFCEVNPLKKVPVIDDNGFIIRESVAILRYLCNTQNCPDHWYPKDLKLRALVDEYLSWHHLETRNKCYSYIRYKSVEPLVSGHPPDENVLNKMESEMNDVLDNLDRIWLKNKLFLTSNSLTIADLLAATELEQLAIANFDPTCSRPALAAWIQRVIKLTNPYYDNVHKRLKYFNKLKTERSLNEKQK